MPDPFEEAVAQAEVDDEVESAEEAAQVRRSRKDATEQEGLTTAEVIARLQAEELNGS